MLGLVKNTRIQAACSNDEQNNIKLQHSAATLGRKKSTAYYAETTWYLT